MNVDDFKKLSPYEQEMVLLLGRLAKAVEALSKSLDE